MERTEPTFVPEWLKSSGGLNTSSSLQSGEQGVSKSGRIKSLDNDLGRPYVRRAPVSNGLAHLRSYNSFNRNNRDRDWNRDIYEFRNKEKTENRRKDYSDSVSSILPSRFEKHGLRRSNSSLSGKRAGSLFGVKTSFERDFPSLGADEKQADSEIKRVASPGLSSAIQSLPPGNSVVIGGDGWTSALAEVPVIQSTSILATTSMNGGRNMAETLAHGPPRTQTAQQLTVGSQRLEDLAVKQSRQLIPMTPSMPKALALNSCDKPKLKIGQSQLQSSHVVNHPNTPRSITMKTDVSKTSTVGKLLVLKPSRERNNISPTAKDTFTPTPDTKLPNSPRAVPSVVEKRPPSSLAQSRSNFFNLMRKKAMTTVDPGEPVAHGFEGGSGSGVVQGLSETKIDLSCNGAPVRSMVNDSGPEAILYSEEEEARFLRSLGWDESAEEEGLTEEEISSFYQNYLNLKPASEILKSTRPKLFTPMVEISSDSKMDS